jgi:hypothetical protein
VLPLWQSDRAPPFQAPSFAHAVLAPLPFDAFMTGRRLLLRRSV